MSLLRFPLDWLGSSGINELVLQDSELMLDKPRGGGGKGEVDRGMRVDVTECCRGSSTAVAGTLVTGTAGSSACIWRLLDDLDELASSVLRRFLVKEERVEIVRGNGFRECDSFGLDGGVVGSPCVDVRPLSSLSISFTNFWIAVCTSSADCPGMTKRLG